MKEANIFSPIHYTLELSLDLHKYVLWNSSEFLLYLNLDKEQIVYANFQHTVIPKWKESMKIMVFLKSTIWNYCLREYVKREGLCIN